MICWESQNTLWYFSSTLAQCAAGFEALLGAFLIFRVQSNANFVDEIFSNALAYLRSTRRLTDAQHPTYAEIKRALSDYKKTDWESSAWLEKIKKVQGVPADLALAGSIPMKWWAFVFIASVAGLLWPLWSGLWRQLGLLQMFSVFVLTLIALWKTKRFVQEALKKPA